MYNKYNIRGIPIIELNSDDLTVDIKQKIDDLIIQICEGSKSFRLSSSSPESITVSVSKIKKELYRRMEKKDIDTIKGMISEFFSHLVLNQEGFKQECLFFNMAERSIKKGFDGVYSKNLKLWIVDSKSGDCKTQNISHSNKLNEAYRSCKGMLAGQSTNDVWAEAFHNVDTKSINTSKKIKDIVIENLLAYENHENRQIDQYNIIPCSTIFTRKSETYNTHSSQRLNGSESIFNRQYHSLIIFHSTNKMFIEFLKYLKEAS